MYCRYCGKQVPDQAVVCVTCGCAPRSGNKHCQACGAETNPVQVVCIKCGVKLGGAGKSRLAAGLLGILLGGFGVHRFYLGYVGIGIAQIAVTLVTCGIGCIWGFIEGILILTGSTNTDANGQPLTD